jgi:hypothetical protein
MTIARRVKAKGMSQAGTDLLGASVYFRAPFFEQLAAEAFLRNLPLGALLRELIELGLEARKPGK